jgi:hypothetical protein
MTEPRHSVKWIDNLLAVGRTLDAKARAGRPSRQPRGETARLSAVHWYLSPVGGAEITNLPDLHSGSLCKRCLLPSGSRTRRRMKVRYKDALSRQCDGVLAQLAEWPNGGPTYNLFAERFLSLHSARDRRQIGWRPVEITNPTKTTPALFEMVRSGVHLEPVALRGGNPDVDRCRACGHRGMPHYPLTGSLPDWLNPEGEDVRRLQPDLFVAVDSLPEPMPTWYTIGDGRKGAYLAVTHDGYWSKGPVPGMMGINAWRLGVVSAPLIVPSKKRAV